MSIQNKHPQTAGQILGQNPPNQQVLPNQTSNVAKVLPLGDLVYEWLLHYYRERVISEPNGRFIMDEHTRRILISATRWLISPSAKPCLLIQGSVGNGKTTLAMAINHTINHLMIKGYINTKATHIADSLTGAMSAAEWQSVQNTLKGLFAIQVLFIDDVGEEAAVVNSWGNEIAPLTKILSERHDRCLTTIMTTNITSELLAKHYGERVFDRISQRYNTITFNRPSFRRG